MDFYTATEKGKSMTENIESDEVRFDDRLTSAGLYRSLFANMQEGMAHCQMIYEGDQPIDFVYLDVNPAFEKITGLTQVIGKRVTQLIPGIRQANPELFAIYGRVAKSSIPEHFETYLASLDISFSVSVFCPAPGEFVAVFNDVSAQKHLEIELREAKAYAESLIENANAMVVELDLAGKVVALNLAGEQMTGYTNAEVVGRSWFELIMPRLRYPDVWAAYKQTAVDGLQRTFENPILTQHGEPRHIRWHSSRRIRRNTVVGTVLFGIDITELKKQEEQLRETQWQLEEAERIAHIGSWSHDLVTGAINWSHEIFRLLRLDPRTTTPSHEAYLEKVHPEDREMVRKAQIISLHHRMPYELTHRLLLADNTLLYVHLSGETRFNGEGKANRAVGTVQDVTLQISNEQELRSSEERFRTIADFTYDWEYWRGKDGSIIYMTPSCERITGYAPIEFSANPLLTTQIVHPDDLDFYEKHLEGIDESTREENIDFRILRKDGAVRWIAHGCRPVFTKDHVLDGRRVCNRDVTERKEAEERANRLAYFDSLTGLPNRRMMEDRLNIGLTQAVRHGRSMAIMFLDLDNFKTVNDTLGHHIGDELLRNVAQRLKEAVRSGDTVARSGGDEFVVVLPEISRPEDAGSVAEKILATLEQPIAVSAHQLQASVSIGIAVYPVAGTDDAQALMQKADQAMYAAKRAGRHRYRFFDHAN
ncbi:MAG: sensor domain-containing diguanylate cyclase [Rhodocyclaceae bacterium]|nr:MAG: sensor domain-containing diguanylate cyclase [Rhodocyclaceae bacterium]